MAADAAGADVAELAGKVDGLVDRLDAMLGHLGTTQTVSQTTQIGGFATGIAVASCVATLLLMISFLIIENRSYAHMDAQIDQLKAWNDVNRAKIAELQARKPQ